MATEDIIVLNMGGGIQNMISPTIDIIIPSYGDTAKDIFPLLRSIDGQIGYDFKRVHITIVDDCSPYPLDISELSFENIRPHVIRLDENAGPGDARQYGVDHTFGEYIMFCDSDDVLASPLVLYWFQKEIQNMPDVCVAKYLEEYYPDKYDERFWLPLSVYSKFFKRKFLTENDIRFPRDIRFYEDHCFIHEVYEKMVTHSEVRDICYLYRFNPNSITKKEQDPYYITHSKDYVKSREIIIESLLKSKKEFKEVDICFAVLEVLVEAFYGYNLSVIYEKGDRWVKENAENLQAFLEKYGDYAKYTEPNREADLIKHFRDWALERCNSFVEQITFADFVRSVREYKKK